MVDEAPQSPLLQQAVIEARAHAADAIAAAGRPPLWNSEALFQGRTTVEISHNGVLYRLQATRLGKLILTK